MRVLIYSSTCLLLLTLLGCYSRTTVGAQLDYGYVNEPIVPYEFGVQYTRAIPPPFDPGIYYESYSYVPNGVNVDIVFYSRGNSARYNWQHANGRRVSRGDFNTYRQRYHDSRGQGNFHKRSSKYGGHQGSGYGHKPYNDGHYSQNHWKHGGGNQGGGNWRNKDNHYDQNRWRHGGGNQSGEHWRKTYGNNDSHYGQNRWKHGGNDQQRNFHNTIYGKHQGNFDSNHDRLKHNDRVRAKQHRQKEERRDGHGHR